MTNKKLTPPRRVKKIGVLFGGKSAEHEVSLQSARNVIEALRYANDNNAATIAFLGFDGGKMKAIASHSVHVKNDHMGQVEGIHAVLQHIIVDALKKEIKDANVP